MVAIKHIILLALGTEALAVSSTDVVCQSKLGSVSVPASKIPRATTTVKNNITILKKVIRKVNVIVIPRPCTTTETETIEESTTVLADPDVETATEIVTDEQTDYETRVHTSTTISTSYTTTTKFTSLTVPAPAGFTGLKEAGDYRARVKARAAPAPVAQPAVLPPGLRSGSQYVQRVDCVKRVPNKVTKVTTATVKGPRITLEPKTKTKAVKTTTTITETKYPAKVTETKTETVSPTVTETVDRTETATITETVAVESVVPTGEPYYAACAGNILDVANGGNGVSDISRTVPAEGSIIIGPQNSYACCAECMKTQPNALMANYHGAPTTPDRMLLLYGLSKQFPNLKSRISLLPNPPGYLAISASDDTNIPVNVLDQRDSFSWSYSQLKSQGFPARAFVDGSFDLPYRLVDGQQGIPVFEINVRLIEGGLLLGIYGHHSVFDAGRMDIVIRSLAELTRDPTKMLDISPPIDINVGSQTVGNDVTQVRPVPDLKELLSRCPEYRLLSAPLGPTQFRIPDADTQSKDIQNTGSIFVIQYKVLRELKKKLAHTTSLDSHEYQPSTFTCLAAITWAHVIKARLSGTRSIPSLSSTKRTIPEEVRLMVSVDWRRRISTHIMSSSAGNSIVLPIASINTSTILAACNEDQDLACSALAIIARAIDEAVLSVNDDFVALRTALFRASPNPRLIGLDFDLCDPRDFYFNTWQHFGTQTYWGLPGLVKKDSSEGIAPDAMRRAQAGFGNGAGLLLPTTDSTKFEILITLDVDSMEVLRTDPSWEHWVEQTFI
ncbi:uncharacterized protein FIESC28_01110 [Fusarium coffeatum]|uniref:Trichothecene 3-O-acetyltransferase n=1 Tax=Fusarium coffeatum TaxID=231269 RepID=A0A366SAU9_9HYPO|nr:uncharacterized protein FIESC28_01110 [Fusarium coffeatum]RBR26082.1 hypothetical protein FIESC28_01110 [Fusarium coffeatum]